MSSFVFHDGKGWGKTHKTLILGAYNRLLGSVDLTHKSHITGIDFVATFKWLWNLLFYWHISGSFFSTFLLDSSFSLAYSFRFPFVLDMLKLWTIMFVICLATVTSSKSAFDAITQRQTHAAQCRVLYWEIGRQPTLHGVATHEFSWWFYIPFYFSRLIYRFISMSNKVFVSRVNFAYSIHQMESACVCECCVLISLFWFLSLILCCQCDMRCYWWRLVVVVAHSAYPMEMLVSINSEEDILFPVGKK